jgi:hypothetical protein
MESGALLRGIKAEVLLQQGTKLSTDDPLFSLIIANQEILNNFSAPFTLALKELPGNIEQSLSKIVMAVEEAEKTTDYLMAETKGALNATANFELAAVQQLIKENIEGSVGGALARAQHEIQALETRIRSLSGSFRDARAVTINIVLSGVVAALLVLFAVGIYVLHGAGMDNRNLAEYWQQQYNKQEKAISSLPLAAQSQFKKALKGG